MYPSMPIARVKMVNNGVELERFAYDPAAGGGLPGSLKLEDAFVVGHVGRFAYQKNHEYLLEAFAAMRRRVGNAKLLLVGEGVLFDDTRALARAAGPGGGRDLLRGQLRRGRADAGDGPVRAALPLRGAAGGGRRGPGRGAARAVLRSRHPPGGADGARSVPAHRRGLRRKMGPGRPGRGRGPRLGPQPGLEAGSPGGLCHPGHRTGVPGALRRAWDARKGGW